MAVEIRGNPSLKPAASRSLFSLVMVLIAAAVGWLIASMQFYSQITTLSQQVQNMSRQTRSLPASHSQAATTSAEGQKSFSGEEVCALFTESLWSPVSHKCAIQADKAVVLATLATRIKVLEEAARTNQLVVPAPESVNPEAKVAMAKGKVLGSVTELRQPDGTVVCVGANGAGYCRLTQPGVSSADCHEGTKYESEKGAGWKPGVTRTRYTCIEKK